MNSIAAVIFIFIIWWFWLSSPKAARSQSDVVDILVDNGVYSPANIEVEQGQNLRLRFLRKDASPCAEKVIFDDLGISADLPIDEKLELAVPTDNKGEYPFTCQMQMYRGKVIVK
ncbi:MAG: cupredoxin domain-containing protein [Thioalkalispiraceae bacterium]